MTDWQARLLDEPNSFRGQRLVLFRHRLDGTTEYLTGQSSAGDPVFATAEPEAIIDSGIVLEYEMIEAIGEAIKPGPSGKELAVLREALEVERRRVDCMLAAAPTVVR